MLGKNDEFCKVASGSSSGLYNHLGSDMCPAASSQLTVTKWTGSGSGSAADAGAGGRTATHIRRRDPSPETTSRLLGYRVRPAAKPTSDTRAGPPAGANAAPGATEGERSTPGARSAATETSEGAAPGSDGRFLDGVGCADMCSLTARQEGSGGVRCRGQRQGKTYVVAVQDFEGSETSGAAGAGPRGGGAPSEPAGGTQPTKVQSRGYAELNNMESFRGGAELLRVHAKLRGAGDRWVYVTALLDSGATCTYVPRRIAGREHGWAPHWADMRAALSMMC